jgi:hypothetical protein
VVGRGEAILDAWVPIDAVGEKSVAVAEKD